MYNYSWFISLYGRNQNNIARIKKQKKILKKGYEKKKQERSEKIRSYKKLWIIFICFVLNTNSCYLSLFMLIHFLKYLVIPAESTCWGLSLTNNSDKPKIGSSTGMTTILEHSFWSQTSRKLPSHSHYVKISVTL